MKRLAEVGGVRMEVDVDVTSWPEIAATVGENTYRLHLTEIGAGLYWAVHDAQSIEISVIQTASGYSVHIGRERVEVDFIEGRRLRAAGLGGAAGPIEVRALMPGKVVDVLVEEGETVEARQGLLIIEAMKMQNETPAPRGGVVQKILASRGDTIGAGDVLMVIETDVDSSAPDVD